MNNSTKKGFTLVETLVVTLIIAIISSIIIVDYNRQKSNQALLFAARQVADDLRVAQNNTVDTMKFIGSVPQWGYGIKFSTISNTSYIVFANRNDDKEYSVADDIVKTVTLPQGIVINSVTTNVSAAGQANIVFMPPFGETFIEGKNASNNSGTTVELTVQLKKSYVSCPSSDCRDIKITSDGKITN